MRYHHLLIVILLTLTSTAHAQQPKPPSVFDLPRIQARQAAGNARIAQLLLAKEYQAAEPFLREAIERVPHDFNAHYNLACVLARGEKNEAALKELMLAVELGFRNRQHIEADADLQPLRESEKFQEILTLADKPLEKAAGWNYQVTPAVPAEGQVLISEANVAWTPKIRMFRALVNFPAVDDSLPIAKGLGQSGDLLRKWHDQKTAAGNHGDLYDNHDSDHSNMNYATLPGLTRVEFSEAAKQRNLHHGAQLAFLYDAPTIGNSSTALTSGPFWRSQPRLILTQPAGAGRLHLQYRASQLYFYPEHRDHDPGHNGGGGYGDLYPANTPYMIISQGSSGSDRPFMNAVAQTLAAFRPEVKAQLIKAGLLMPTVQMIFRRSNKQVTQPEDYLTGKAHPTVFEGNQLDVVGMVKLAHGMTTDSIPPLVQLQITEEDQAVVGRDYFDTGDRERMFDTPCAIARVVKSTKYQRRMVVSAQASRDLHGKPLTYQWAVLRGDAERITVNKLNDAGSVVELLVDYHQRRSLATDSDMASSRVDIGAFVHNGEYYSAPAMISLTYLDNEQREYDDQQRIVAVDYTGEVAKNYVDPLLDIRKDWRDEYHYTEGTLTGWTRLRGDQREEFTAEGRLITKRDENGEPIETVAVRYVAQQREGKLPLLVSEVVE